jgi:class 3 adenylate cyclase
VSQMVDPSQAERALDALGRHAWREAYDLLSEADTGGTVTPDQLELLAQASWWVGRLPEAIEARERAYAAYVKAGDPVLAAKEATLVGRDNLLKNAHSVARAWMNRAERLLEGSEENPAHGWLAVTRAFQAGLEGDFEEAFARASKAREIADRFGDRDLAAVALSAEGLSMIFKGQVEQGLAMMDEATVPAVSGELEPQVAGAVCCSAIEACASLGDWLRAAQWTEAQDRWCERERITGFPGMCRLYRAEIKRLRGDWLEAEAEARRATDELQGFIPAAVGLALYEIGLIRLRRGDLTAAEDALLRAHTYGRDPEPALSLLRLAQGKVDIALASIKRALDDPPQEPSWAAPPGSDLNRILLLPAHVEIALAAGDVNGARGAADELAALAERFGSTAAKATAASAQGAMLAAAGDVGAATQALRRGIQLWTELDAPYEAARARMTLAEAHAADGSPERAVIELQTAKATFERLGAMADLRRADETLAELPGVDVRPLQTGTQRAAKAFVFTDIVDSTKLAELMGDEAWDKVMRWHDQALRTLVAEHGGEEVKGTGDGFLLTFDDPDHAIECAIAIQRRLADQGRTQGFAPSVRIGIHWAEATRTGLDYIGTGVNQAARIGAHADGAEVLVSVPTLGQSRRPFAESRRQTVELKGISAPVEVVSIDWR